MKKYDLKKIMARAWEIKRKADLKTQKSIKILEKLPLMRNLKKEEEAVFSECLKMAWAEAKRAAEIADKLEISMENAEWIAEYEGNLKMQGHRGISWSIWQGYGHYRAYYKCADMSKYWNSKKDHYIDLEETA